MREHTQKFAEKYIELKKYVKRFNFRTLLFFNDKNFEEYFDKFKFFLDDKIVIKAFATSFLFLASNIL